MTRDKLEIILGVISGRLTADNLKHEEYALLDCSHLFYDTAMVGVDRKLQYAAEQLLLGLLTDLMGSKGEEMAYGTKPTPVPPVAKSKKVAEKITGSVYSADSDVSMERYGEINHPRTLMCYEIGIGVDGAPKVRNMETGKYYFLSWVAILEMAIEAGIDKL